MMWYISRRDARFLEDCSLLVSFNRKCLDLTLYFHWRKGSKPRAGLRPPTGKRLTHLGLQLEGVAREGTQAGSTYHVPLLCQGPELHSLVLQLSWCPQPSPQFSDRCGGIHSDRLGVGPLLVTDDFDCHLDILNQSGEQSLANAEDWKSPWGAQRTSWPEHWLSHTLGIRLWCFPTMDPNSRDFRTRRIYTQLWGSQWVTPKSAYTHPEHSLPFTGMSLEG